MSHTADSQPTNHTKSYLKIFGALFVLTVIEVVIAQIGIPYAMLVILLIALALVKAGLVAVYFMHLKYESRFLSVIAYAPLAVASILIIMVSLEWIFQPKWLF
ncbi:MAG TPA: cytochrome C oxidase subunit IV family protein [Candidatus Kapabacteria bacterium]